MKKLSSKKGEYAFLKLAFEGQSLVFSMFLTVSAAVISAVAYDPFHFYLLLPLGFALLLKATAESKSTEEAALIGFTYGFLFYLFLCWWLANVLNLYFLPFLLSFYEALFICLAAAISRHFFVKREANWHFFPMALLFFLAERIREAGEFAFPWANSGVVFSGTIFSESLEMFGSIGVSFIVWLMAASLISLIIQRRIRYMFIFFILILLLFIPVGIDFNSGKAERMISIAAGQENLTPEEKHESDPAKRQSRNFESFFELYHKLLNTESSLIVLPESSFPDELNEGDFWFEKLKRDSIAKNKVIVVGAMASENERHYNRIYVFDHYQVKIYDKRNLVPFGEYIPLRPWLNFIDAFVYKVDLSRGKRGGVANTSLGKLGIGICWESALPWYGRNLAMNGAELLIFVTNDNWYGNSPQNVQHFRHTIYQSDSTGLSVIQSANAGVTGYYFDGKSRSLPLWKHEILVGKVPLQKPNKILLLFQSLIEKVTLAVSGLVFLITWWKIKIKNI